MDNQFSTRAQQSDFGDVVYGLTYLAPHRYDQLYLVFNMLKYNFIYAERKVNYFSIAKYATIVPELCEQKYYE